MLNKRDKDMLTLAAEALLKNQSKKIFGYSII